MINPSINQPANNQVMNSDERLQHWSVLGGNRLLHSPPPLEEEFFLSFPQAYSTLKMYFQYDIFPVQRHC